VKIGEVENLKFTSPKIIQDFSKKIITFFKKSFTIRKLQRILVDMK